MPTYSSSKKIRMRNFTGPLLPVIPPKMTRILLLLHNYPNIEIQNFFFFTFKHLRLLKHQGQPAVLIDFTHSVEITYLPYSTRTNSKTSEHLFISLLFVFKADSVSYRTSFLPCCRIWKDRGHVRKDILSWPRRCPTDTPQPAAVHQVLQQPSQVRRCYGCDGKYLFTVWRICD